MFRNRDDLRESLFNRSRLLKELIYASRVPSNSGDFYTREKTSLAVDIAYL